MTWRQGFNNFDFEADALELWALQYQRNSLYKEFSDLLSRTPTNVTAVQQIPFLPIAQFKTAPVICGQYEPEAVFTSSGTTGAPNSRHFVERLSDYQASFTSAFRQFYGDPSGWCMLALLPSYMERSGSSLVYMAEELIRMTGHPCSGFFLHDIDKLHQLLMELESKGQKTMLLGVTFALMDFAEKYPMNLHHTVVMETGGMKGRRKEVTREEVHILLMERLGVASIHSEYGMTELLSQAYSKGKGIFRSPHWMQVLIRAEDDPLCVSGPHPERVITGAINVVDLANRSSCAFIATDDLGRLYPDGSFEVIGRIDNSDIRGCSLMYL